MTGGVALSGIYFWLTEIDAGWFDSSTFLNAEVVFLDIIVEREEGYSILLGKNEFV